MPFTTRLITGYVDGRDYEVMVPLVWASPSGGEITVPGGALTDFASVPPPFRWLIPPAGTGGKRGRYGPAAVVHDYLYRHGRLRGGHISRLYADNTFRQVMSEDGVSYWLHTFLWLGVRLGGWWTWRRYRRRE